MAIRPIVFSLLSVLAPFAAADSLEVKAGNDTFRFETEGFSSEQSARLQKFLDRVGAIQWEKSTALHDEVFGAKAGGATYLRYLQTHAAGFAYSSYVERTQAFRPPVNGPVYGLRKSLQNYFATKRNAIHVGREVFASDEMSDHAFYNLLFQTLMSARMVSRHEFVPCSTAAPSDKDLLPAEDSTNKECDKEVSGPYSTGTLFAMALQLNEKRSGIDLAGLPVATRLTGEARRRILADIEDSPLYKELGTLLLTINMGNGILEFRACPVPPRSAGRVEMDKDACRTLTDGRGLDVARNPELHVSAPRSINSTQMNNLMSDAQAVMEQEPINYRARVVQRAIENFIPKRESKL